MESSCVSKQTLGILGMHYSENEMCLRNTILPAGVIWGHTHIRTYIYTYVRSYVHTRTRAHTSIHAWIRTDGRLVGRQTDRETDRRAVRPKKICHQ